MSAKSNGKDTPDAEVEVFRFDPHQDEQPRFEAFQIPYHEWKDKKVLEVLHYLFENHDGSLAFGESCTVQHCGSCGIRMNGRSILACDVPAEVTMKLEPLHIKRVLKDLLVDQSLGKYEKSSQD